MTDLSNNAPMNQAALRWLQEAKASPEQHVNYLAQLAAWGLEKGLVEVAPPVSPSQPERDDVVLAVEGLLRPGAKAVVQASQWFLSNPNLSEEDAEASLEHELEQARNPQQAAQAVVETAYSRMVAASAYSPE